MVAAHGKGKPRTDHLSWCGRRASQRLIEQGGTWRRKRDGNNGGEGGGKRRGGKGLKKMERADNSRRVTKKENGEIEQDIMQQVGRAEQVGYLEIEEGCPFKRYMLTF